MWSRVQLEEPSFVIAKFIGRVNIIIVTSYKKVFVIICVDVIIIVMAMMAMTMRTQLAHEHGHDYDHAHGYDTIMTMMKIIKIMMIPQHMYLWFEA